MKIKVLIESIDSESKTKLTFTNCENGKTLECTIEESVNDNDNGLDDKWLKNGEMTDAAKGLFQSRNANRDTELQEFLAPKVEEKRPVEKPKSKEAKSDWKKLGSTALSFLFSLAPAAFAAVVAAQRNVMPEAVLEQVAKAPGIFANHVEIGQGIVAAVAIFCAASKASTHNVPFVSTYVSVSSLTNIASVAGVAHFTMADSRITFAAAALTAVYQYGTNTVDAAKSEYDAFGKGKAEYYQAKTTKLALPTLCAVTAYAFNSNISSLVAKGSEVAANHMAFTPVLAVAAAGLGMLANKAVVSGYTKYTTLEKGADKKAKDANKAFKAKAETYGLPVCKAVAFGTAAFIASSNVLDSIVLKGAVAVAVAAASVANEVAAAYTASRA